MTRDLEPKTFTVFHQNIASILAKQEILELTIQELQDTGTDPDVICLTETFLKSGYERYLNIKHYELATSYCRDQRRGGTCILVKKGLLCRDLTFLKTYTSQKTFEACGIHISSTNTVIICLYRTPTSDPNLFLDKLHCMLIDIYKKYNRFKIIIAGDININTLKSGRVTTRFQDLADNNNLKIHITVPTRKLSCIDHILSNVKDATATVLPLHISDHETAQLLSFPIEGKKLKPSSHTIYRRDYCLSNILKFRECLGNLSWSEVYEMSDPETSFSEFHEMFTLLYKLCFPKIKIKINNNKRKINWISKGLKRSCKTKRMLRYNYYKNKSITDKNKYIKYSGILKKCIRKSKQNSYSKFITSSKNKCKASWTLVKEELLKNEINEKFIYKINNNNKILTNPQDIAAAFNDHFIQSTKIPPNNQSQHTDPTKYRLPNSMFLSPMMEIEVKKEVLSLKNTNSEGYDEINTKVVKSCFPEISKILTHLINMTFSTGIFPTVLKQSVVKPLFKKDSKVDINNYRPITLIPIFSKILEKCMLKRIIEFCNKYDIIKKEQYGFQKDKSTTLAIFSLIDIILHNINNNNWTTGLFFDLSKAFDFVSHDILLKKLDAIGIRGLPLQWISTYLSHRRQCVVVTNINTKNEEETYSSNFKENNCGVPQGSVLGPILFLFYINDIVSVTNHKCILFADDISIIVTSNKKNKSINDHEHDINQTINNVIKYLDINNMKPNLNKTYYIQFNDNNRVKLNIDMNIKYLDEKIKKVKDTKFLGVLIDQDLNWKSHLNNLSSRLNKFVYALSHIKKHTNLKTAVVTYHAYVESILRYGLILWGNSTDVNRAFITQKKCIRAIFGKTPRDSCKPLFKSLGLLPLPSLYIYDVCLFVRKHPYLFKRACETNSRLKRDPQRLVISVQPKLRKYNKNCPAMCVKIYNNLPKDLKCLNDRQFKIKLYQWLHRNNFYDLKDYLDKKRWTCMYP